jgi:hypothetical protein
MNLDQINGKPFAIVLSDDKGEGAAFHGVARWDGKTLTIDRGRDKPPFEVRKEWYERIQPVKGPVAKAILEDAEFWLQLRVGPVPDDDTTTFEPTGLKWPE